MLSQKVNNYSLQKYYKTGKEWKQKRPQSPKNLCYKLLQGRMLKKCIINTFVTENKAKTDSQKQAS